VPPYFLVIGVDSKIWTNNGPESVVIRSNGLLGICFPGKTRVNYLRNRDILGFSNLSDLGILASRVTASLPPSKNSNFGALSRQDRTGSLHSAHKGVSVDAYSKRVCMELGYSFYWEDLDLFWG
jgi:hypothetical protein